MTGRQLAGLASLLIPSPILAAGWCGSRQMGMDEDLAKRLARDDRMDPRFKAWLKAMPMVPDEGELKYQGIAPI